MDGQQRAGYGADVDEHVAGVGQQHEGVGDDRGGDLERHEGHEEAEGHDERATVGLGGDAAGTDVSVTLSHARSRGRRGSSPPRPGDARARRRPRRRCGSLRAATNESGQAQLGQVLGDGGGLRTHQLGQLVDRTLPLHQGPDHPQTGLVAEELQHADGGPDVVGRRNLPYLRRHADRLSLPSVARAGPRTSQFGRAGVAGPVQACGGGGGGDRGEVRHRRGGHGAGLADRALREGGLEHRSHDRPGHGRPVGLDWLWYGTTTATATWGLLAGAKPIIQSWVSPFGSAVWAVPVLTAAHRYGGKIPPPVACGHGAVGDPFHERGHRLRRDRAGRPGHRLRRVGRHDVALRVADLRHQVRRHHEPAVGDARGHHGVLERGGLHEVLPDGRVRLVALGRWPGAAARREAMTLGRSIGGTVL